MKTTSSFKNFPKGLFISLEGIEGSGKTTQILKIRDHFAKQKRQVTIFREPGGTSFGEGVRDVILKSKETVCPLSEALLFASSRAQLLKSEILPRLKNNEIVILDRFVHSSIAYQGFGRGVTPETITSIHSIEPLNIIPNFTFYLKISIKTSLERQIKRGNEKDYFEKETNKFYEKVTEGFDHCAQFFNNTFHTIDAEMHADEVFKSILEQLEK